MSARNVYASYVPTSGEVLRFVSSYTWVASQRQVIDVPRGNDIDSLIVVIEGTFTLSTGATTASAVAPAQLLESVQWKKDGAYQFEDSTGILAAFGNFERGLARDVVAPGVGIATHPVRCTYRLDRVTPDGVRAKDSMLHTSQAYMGSQQLILNAGTINACYSAPGSMVVSATAITVTVYTVELQEGTPLGMTEGRWIRRHTQYALAFASANAAFTQQIPTNTYMRGVKLLAVTTSTGEPVAGGINRIQIRSGSNIRIDITETALRAKNQSTFDLQTTQLSAVPGLSYADLLVDHSLKTLWNLWNASEAILQLDVDAGITVYAQVINYDIQPAVDMPQRRVRQIGMAAIRNNQRMIAASAVQRALGPRRPPAK